ncbi:MAG: hypothetical protein COS34_06010 [Lysobacterales bacterium CG02_land_8_20_14_3_00_62_12]|nr:MAG: hypothetical protein COS34_06010 [Xanthomonadales bacterium CG02_land_8_20_14_3_00_62_12]
MFKTWLSRAPSRNPMKRSRDAKQAEAIRQMLNERLPQFPLVRAAFRSFPEKLATEHIHQPGPRGFR